MTKRYVDLDAVLALIQRSHLDLENPVDNEDVCEGIEALPVVSVDGDLVSRAGLLAEYDRQHEGPPGRARKLIEDAPAVPQETSVVEESRLMVSWRWLEDFAREHKSEQYAEFVLAAKLAYISSIEKMYGQWAREHEERDNVGDTE